MIAIKEMTLHNPLFLSGTNLGSKLPMARQGIKMFYDEDHSRYIVIYNGKGKFVHETNVADAEPVDPKHLGIELEAEKKSPPRVTGQGSPMKANVSRTAQISDPTRGMK